MVYLLSADNIMLYTRADLGFFEGRATQLKKIPSLKRSVAQRPRTAEGRAGGGCMEGVAPSRHGVRGLHPRKIFEILHAKSCILGDNLLKTLDNNILPLSRIQ